MEHMSVITTHSEAVLTVIIVLAGFALEARTLNWIQVAAVTPWDRKWSTFCNFITQQGGGC